MQIQADLLGTSVERPKNIETTALGAALLAGLGAGIWPDTDALSEIRAVDRTFVSNILLKDRRTKMKTWKKAIKRAQHWDTIL